MKNLMTVLVAAAMLAACAPDKPQVAEADESKKSAVEEVIDPTKGIGQVKNVTLHNPLDAERVQRGKDIYDMKCSACHQLTDQRVVGPGFKDVTKRRKPEWIMNMITNVDVMLDEDPVAQELLELCLMRMPNQNVSIGDARDILEFMRKNDGEE
ncbi:MAG: c-type cytochrome [Cyclobacteriaceae bacterium]|nr:MAG: c-type cytochrome [Cyclobacteriaceae bacterium]